MNKTGGSKRIFYCAVARGLMLLSEFTESKGTSYREFTNSVLKRIKVGRTVMEFQMYILFIKYELYSGQT